MTEAIQHHPIFNDYTCWTGISKRGMSIDYLGVYTRQEFYGAAEEETGGKAAQGILPAFDEEYFEWVDGLTAVKRAKRSFTMLELGAGWGRWLIRAGAAARQRGLKTYLVGIEAEPTHYRYMRTHFRDNGQNPRRHWLLEAAVAEHSGWVNFHMGDPSLWYGQAIDSNRPQAEPPGFWKALHERLFSTSNPQKTCIRPTRAVGLCSTLGKLGFVDFIDADIQGSEASVFESAAELLDSQVRSVHIGTHAEEQEDRLRRLFTGLDWLPGYDYTCLKENDTPFGRIKFGDGVQSWVNPRLQAA